MAQTLSARRNHGFLYLCIVVAFVLASLLITLSSGLPFTVRRTVSDLGLIVAGLFAAVSGAFRVRSTHGHRRRTWILMASGGLSAMAGNIWVFEAHLNNRPEPAGSNVFFAIAVILAIALVISFPSVPRRGLDLVRILFDGLVIGASLLSIVGVTVVPQLLAAPEADSGASTASLVLVVIEVILCTLAAMLVLRGNRADRTVLLLVSAGGFCYSVTDLIRASLAANNDFAFGGPLDVGWMAGYAALGLAARYAVGDDARTSEAAATPPLVSSSVVFGAFLIAAFCRVAFLDPSNNSLLTSIVWVIVLLAVTLRQGLLIADNESLRRDLEARVRERTSQLEDLTRRSETMLTSVGDGIYGVDPDGVITFVNPSAASMLGQSSSALIGQRAHDLFHAPQPDGTPFPYESCYIAEAVRHGATTNSEEDSYLGPHGEPFPVEVTASPLISNNRVEGAVVVFRDMTQRREVDKMKSEFVSVVSHELRTPLTSIRGSLGLLSAGALGELTAPAKRMVKIALDSSERLTRLINDILDIERIESGTMPMQMDRHVVADLLRTATDQVQALASEAGVRLVIGSDDGVVWADGDRVVQTLVNLLGNAIKFSDAHSVVELETSAEGDFVTFHVRDQGRGIPADKLDRVFRRFEQVDSSDAREKGGSGLGLAISRSIVERHGGEIWVDSQVGVGTQFSFTIPRLAPAVADEAVEGPTIIVCDDDPATVQVFCAMLQKNGYRAIGVENGRQAIELASEQLPAAVLVDLLMAGTSGSEVISALRDNPRTRDIPLVVVSGLEPGGDLDLAGRTDEWLTKPVDEERLIRALGRAIAEHQISGRVLLVEDDEALASVLTTLLERRGLVVDHARDRRQALRMVEGARPGVLILDLHLPDGNGAELVDAMRDDQRLTDLPVVVYSADDVPAGERDHLRLGTTIFLTKGRANPELLEHRVLELIELALESGSEPASRATVGSAS
ncbi:PAS domain S-box-containing protein [Friedmanniella endophytica]|uniref:histidine kinase n=1 Tax=Microlunatus kandeliicorticis TaxID=1759536 RepID=A0A7W3IQ47_9ACTN|nr:response regulator [Microlunatus kandeliicorticis]MBA8793173.1 PAS domain S-box-containing protein [Microlunatus kandeliicorticis]